MLNDYMRYGISDSKGISFLPTKIQLLITVVKNGLLLPTNNLFLITVNSHAKYS